MLREVLLPDGKNLVVKHIKIDNEIMTVEINSAQTTANCPDCAWQSGRVHSRYKRTIADLAWADKQIELHWQARRFFCDAAKCKRKTFVERRPTMVKLYARRTNRLAQKQRKIGWLIGGTVASRLLRHLKIPTSRYTLIRLIRSGSPPEPPPPRVVGVDDWAYRKGNRYGTIVVDLERHQVIDLLPERSSESLANWLKAHPDIEIVSRDRASVYREGVDQGCPDAIQVADRWHLLKNLKESLQRLLERNRACLQAAGGSIPPKKEQSAPPDAIPEKTPTRQEKQSQQARQYRLERYQMVIKLHQFGQDARAISRAVGLCRKTVRKYIDAGSFPDRSTPTRYNHIINPYLDYLNQQWTQGQHNACQLYRDIKKQGFPGSRATVRRWATKMRKTITKPSEADKLAKQAQVTFARPCSAQYATWLLLGHKPDLSSDKQAALDRILKTSDDVTRAYNFAQVFLRIVRQRLSKALDPWLEAVITYRVPGLYHFAQGLKKDLDPIRAALTLPWSNGQVEGHVNRLKLIKRQMYGRANFDLLRLRVLSL